MPREITTHKTHKLNALNEALDIYAVDEPGPGGANHKYTVGSERAGGVYGRITFQNGPVQEVGVNGLSNEALIAIVMDRLIGFQKGEFANNNNAMALACLRNALSWCQLRTRDRIARGVEGFLKA